MILLLDNGVRVSSDARRARTATRAIRLRDGGFHRSRRRPTHNAVTRSPACTSAFYEDEEGAWKSSDCQRFRGANKIPGPSDLPLTLRSATER
jgi:hypothetical protein